MAYELLKLKNQLCFRLYTASRLITQAYYSLLDEIGLTYPQYLVMMVLWEKDCQKVMEISHRLELDSNTMTPLLKRMKEEGFVNRRKGKKDGRETFIFLTKKGKELEEKAKNIPHCMIDKLSSDKFQTNDIEELINSLDILIEQLHKRKLEELKVKTEIKNNNKQSEI
jgi:hypothetical protein